MTFVFDEGKTETATSSETRRVAELMADARLEAADERMVKKRATAEMKVDDRALIDTDVVPEIDRDALAGLEARLAGMDSAGRILFHSTLHPELVRHGTLLAPATLPNGWSTQSPGRKRHAHVPGRCLFRKPS